MYNDSLERQNIYKSIDIDRYEKIFFKYEMELILLSKRAPRINPVIHTRSFYIENKLNKVNPAFETLFHFKVKYNAFKGSLLKANIK